MDIVDWVKKQTGKIADNVKDYKFYVKHTPEIIDSSTTLTLTPFANRDERETVSCAFKWSKIKNGLITEVPEFKGDSFICQPADVGSILQAQITSTDPGHPGTAILRYGPVKLDIQIKRQIEHALASGTALLNVDLVQKQCVRECQLKITEQTIKVNHCNSNLYYIFDYNLNEPRIEASIKQPNKINISFNEKYEDQIKPFISSLFGGEDLTQSLKVANEHRLELKFGNRSLRDNFLFIVKAFNTKKTMKDSSVINQIQNLDLNKNDTFNYMLEIENLKTDIIKLSRVNQKCLSDKKMYYEEARKYEKEIQEIIITYTKIAENKLRTVNQLDQSVLELREKKNEVMERKIDALMRENFQLKEMVEEMRRQNSHIAVPSMRRMQEEQEPRQQRGGFMKKKQAEEVEINNILDKLDESQVKGQAGNDDQIKKLSEEKKYLAKKLNESVMKNSKLEEKIRKITHNQTAVNLNNQSGMSMDQGERVNVTSQELEHSRLYSQIQELKKSNKELKKENNRLRSDIPVISSETERYNVVLVEPKGLQQRQKTQSQNPETFGFVRASLENKIKELSVQNQRLKDELQMMSIEKEMIMKEKAGVQAKYKKKLSELMNQNSMYRKNQDALNRSQNLSMEMDVYNEEQNNLLKEQNEFLAGENEKLTKMVEKYMGQAKQIPKLREQILELKAKLKRYQEKKKAELSFSKSEDEILLLND